jgi:hypothetical protein
MKKALFLLVVMSALTCMALAQSDYSAMSDKGKSDGSNWDMMKYSDKYDNKNSVNGADNCYYDQNGKKCCEKCSEKCYLFVQCDRCGEKHRCDSKCDTCGEKCKVLEYCPSCGTEYAVEMADGYCDKCGKECYWSKQCNKCGNTYYFDGSCDQCGARCHYDKCCYDFCDKYCYEYADKCKEQCPSCDKLPKPCKTCMKTAEELKPMIYRPMMQDP